MAVSLKGGDSGGGLLAMLGVSSALLSKAKNYGVVFEQSSPGTYLVKDSLSHVHGVIPIKGQAITLAYEGKLGPASKQALQFQFTQAVEKAIAATKPPTTGGPEPISAILSNVIFNSNEVNTPLGSADACTPDPEDYQLLAAKPIDCGSINAALNKNKIGKISKNTVSGVIPLIEAKTIGQKVLGTSANSIYVVFVLFDGMAMALRRKGSKLSLRAEGDLKKYSSGLISVGFEMHDNYSSVHLHVADSNLLKKTVGAVIGAVGLSSVLCVGDVEKMVALCQ